MTDVRKDQLLVYFLENAHPVELEDEGKDEKLSANETPVHNYECVEMVWRVEKTTRWRCKGRRRIKHC
jgi:hypothetical protein